MLRDFKASLRVSVGAPLHAALLIALSGCGNPSGEGSQGLHTSGTDAWRGVVSCMHLTGDDMSSHGAETSLDVNASASTVTLSHVEISALPGYECSGLTLQGVASGASATASGSFTINRFETDCSDDDGSGITASGQGSIAANMLRLTLFLISEDNPINSAQCFYTLMRR